MNESAKLSPPIFAPKWAIFFGAALLAALTGVVILASLDKGQRARLETTSETTAVGDVRYFQPPADLKTLPVVGAVLNGQPLLVASVETIGVRDTHLRRVGFDPARGLSIYELSAAANDEDRQRLAAAGGGYLLKLAPNDYVSARAAGP
jgi:hypothetical protein